MTRRVLLAVCTPGDPHGPAGRDALARRGASCLLLDLAELPRRATFTQRDGRPSLAVDGRALPLDELRGLFWRRPRAWGAHPDLWRPSHREFAALQWQESLLGALDSLPARWVNHPARGDAADRKTLQLRLAPECGLAVPRTLVSSDPAAARAFVDALGGPGCAVVKHLRALPGVGRETQLIDAEAIARLDQLRLAPAILQERVPGVDLRVTVAGDAVLAAEIDATDASYPLDWRVDWDRARVRPATIPDAVAAGLRALLARLGLLYGAFDLRRTPAGEHVFLEVNPFGRWLFVEERTGQPITEAVVEALLG